MSAEGRTAVMVAAGNNNLHVLQHLVESSKANVNAQDQVLCILADVWTYGEGQERDRDRESTPLCLSASLTLTHSLCLSLSMCRMATQR